MKLKHGKVTKKISKLNGQTSDDMMLHNIVAQNKFDIAPYRKYGKSRTASGKSI